jgi:hypothetical protein
MFAPSLSKVAITCDMKVRGLIIVCFSIACGCQAIACMLQPALDLLAVTADRKA